MLKITTAPHLQTSQDIRGIMRDVLIALLPAAAAGVLVFGINALVVVLTSVAACAAVEYAANRWWFKKGNTVTDLSALVTGMLLGFNLPSSMPLWMILIGAFAAIVPAKLCYGGLGKNIFNPALVGRVFLFISFPVQMTHWPIPQFMHIFNFDAQTAATPLNILKHLKQGSQAVLPSISDMFLGNTGGCIGEVSVLALLFGFGWLLWRRIISWRIPIFYVGTVFAVTGVLWLITGDIRYHPVIHVFSGGLMLGAIFMATDYATSPMTMRGQLIFAVGCGILTAVIRLCGTYPEGVSFAILIMNAFVPLIDKFVEPRYYGQRR